MKTVQSISMLSDLIKKKFLIVLFGAGKVRLSNSADSKAISGNADPEAEEYIKNYRFVTRWQTV